MIVNFVHEFYAKCNRTVVILRAANHLKVILSLQLVTFHNKSDKTGTPQFGLIAEDCRNRPRHGGARNTARGVLHAAHDAVNAMMLATSIATTIAGWEEQRAAIGRLGNDGEQSEREDCRKSRRKLEQQTRPKR